MKNTLVRGTYPELKYAEEDTHVFKTLHPIAPPLHTAGE